MNVDFLPILHGAAEDPTGWLNSNWTLDPGVVLATLVLGAGYLYLTSARFTGRNAKSRLAVSTGQKVSWLLGCFVFFVALGPPIDSWSDEYLASAHMSQHMLLIFAVVPLWLYGIPAWMLRPLERNAVTNRVGYALTRAVPALAISNAIVAFWHVPGVYSRALESEPVHILQHGAILVAAILAWWPVLGPLPAWPRLSEPLQCLYLFLYSLPGGLIGAAITFASVPLYDFYAESERIFGISLAMDQQLAGLLMWVGGSTIYLLWITVIFLRWGGREDRAEYASRPQGGTIGKSQVLPR